MNFSKFHELDKKLLVKVIAGVTLLTIAFVFYLIRENIEDEGVVFSEVGGSSAEAVIQTTETAVEKEDVLIIVDVAGAVKQPSVVKLPESSRIFEAVEQAGGYSDDADTRAINQAEILTDGQKIYIPTKQEMAEALKSSSSSDSAGIAGSRNVIAAGVDFNLNTSSGQSKLININTADSASLQQLAGVGPATAEKIINYRSENGKFKTIEEIKNVSGIGDKTFEKFKNKITV